MSLVGQFSAVVMEQCLRMAHWLLFVDQQLRVTVRHHTQVQLWLVRRAQCMLRALLFAGKAIQHRVVMWQLVRVLSLRGNYGYIEISN